MGGKGSGRSSWKSDDLKEKLGTYQPCRAKNGKSKDNQDNPGNYTPPRCPNDLGKDGQRLWRRVVGYWRLDPGELFLLERACTMLDQLIEVEQALAKTGITSVDAKGEVIPHPLTKLRKDTQLEFSRWWDRLNLKHEIPED